MFKIEGYCDDKYVVSIMKAAANLHIMDFRIVPVANAQAKNGKLVAETSGDPIELFAAWIKRHKLKEISTQQIKVFVTGIGKSETYRYYLVDKAKEAKMIKRNPGTPNGAATYQVIK